MPAFTTSILGYDSLERTPEVLVQQGNIQIAKEEGQLSLFAYKMVLYTFPYIKALKILRKVFFKIH